MTKSQTNLEIADTIKEQLGNKALVMMGAKNLIANDKGIHFRIGRNCKKVSIIQIKLNWKDLYDITFLRTRTILGVPEAIPINIEEDIYFDMLKDCIERNTGLYLSL